MAVAITSSGPADTACSCHTKCHLRTPPNSLLMTPVTQSVIYVQHQKQSSCDTGHTRCVLRTPPNSLVMTPVTQRVIYVHHQSSYDTGHTQCHLRTPPKQSSCDTGHTKWPADAVCSCHTKCKLRTPPNSLPATPVTQSGQQTRCVAVTQSAIYVHH